MMIGQGKGGGLDTLMNSPLMQTLGGNNQAPEMAGNAANLDMLSMLRGNKDYWDQQQSTIGQGARGGLQDLANLFLSNQPAAPGGAMGSMAPITQPQAPRMIGGDPGLQRRPPVPAATTGQPVQPQRPALRPRDRWGYR